MSSKATSEVAQVSLSSTKASSLGVDTRLSLKSSSGLVTLRAILSDALPKKPKTKRASKFEEPGAAGTALVAALVVYSGVAWL